VDGGNPPRCDGDRPPGPLFIARLREFLHTGSAGGVVLVVAALIAVVWAKSPWKDARQDL
jgi:Na+/H+ antiporter NhaA